MRGTCSQVVDLSSHELVQPDLEKAAGNRRLQSPAGATADQHAQQQVVRCRSSCSN